MRNYLEQYPTYHRLLAWEGRNRHRIWPVALGLGAVLLVISVSFLVWSTFIRTHEEAAMLGTRHWERSVEIEQYRALDKESWSRPPSDAYNESTTWEIRTWERYISHYRTVTSSYSCGTYQSPRTCTRTSQEPVYSQRPVYDTRYHYTVDRWVTSRWVDTAGEELEPAWATPAGLIANPPAVLGTERIGDERKQEYSFELSCEECDPGQSVKLDFAEWKLLRSGQLVTAHVNSRGKVRGIEVAGG